MANAQNLGALKKPALAGVNNLTQDPQGFLHLGDDGVQRSYTAKGEVIDYCKLSNPEIMRLIEASKLPAAAEEEVKRAFAGVDGRDVTAEEQLMHPPKHLRPDESQFRIGRNDERHCDPPNNSRA